MLLSDKVIAIYCLVDDLLKTCDHHTTAGCRCSDAEIITTALVSALLFKGNQSIAIEYMRTHNMAPALPLKSGFTSACTGWQSCSTAFFNNLDILSKS